MCSPCPKTEVKTYSLLERLLVTKTFGLLTIPSTVRLHCKALSKASIAVQLN